MRHAIPLVLPLLLPVPITAQDGTATPKTWVEQLTDESREKRDAAVAALLRAGAEATPALQACVVPGNEWSPRETSAVELLGRLGRHAVAAIPTLLERLQDTTGRQSDLVLTTVDEIAPYAPGSFWEIETALGKLYLRSQRQSSLHWIPSDVTYYRSMNRLELNVECSTYRLIRTLETGNSFQRELAADLLIESPGERAPKVAALTTCLRRIVGPERVMLRLEGPGLIGRLGKMIDNSRPERLHVARAIIRLSTRKDVPIEAWVVLLQHADKELVRLAIQTLAISGRADGVPGLITLTTAADPVIAWEAITALGMLGPIAKDAATALQRLSTGADANVARRAKIALRSIRRRD